MSQKQMKKSQEKKYAMGYFPNDGYSFTQVARRWLVHDAVAVSKDIYIKIIQI